METDEPTLVETLTAQRDGALHRAWRAEGELVKLALKSIDPEVTKLAELLQRVTAERDQLKGLLEAQ